MTEQEKSSEKYFFAINESRVAFATYEEAKAAREQAMDDAGYFSPWPTAICTIDASGKTIEVQELIQEKPMSEDAARINFRRNTDVEEVE